MIEKIFQSLFGLFLFGFTIWFFFVFYLMSKEIGNAWKMEKKNNLDHKHDRKWSKEEYFQHIKDEHPDIWKEHMEGEEEG